MRCLGVLYGMSSCSRFEKKAGEKTRRRVDDLPGRAPMPVRAQIEPHFQIFNRPILDDNSTPTALPYFASLQTLGCRAYRKAILLITT